LRGGSLPGSPDRVEHNLSINEEWILNRRSFVYGRLKFTVLLVVALLLSASASWAQTPSVLEEIKLVTEDQGQAAFILRFSPQEPSVETARTDPAAVTVLIRNTLRSPQIPGSFRYRGLVRAVEFQSNRPDLAVRFLTSSPARVSIEPAENNVILIKVQKVTSDESIGSRPLGSSDQPVVKASDLAQPVSSTTGDRYEMIFLRYADVSEVIGLLGEGISIEPNNTFIRREPGFGSLGANNQSNFLQPQTQDQKPGPPLGQSLANGLGANRRLNAIWVTGTPERIERIREQITLIDVPVDSVILETQFVELTESGAKNLGIDLNNSSGQIAVGRIETGAFLPFNVNPNDVLPSGVLQAAIYAQVEKGEGRILSRPRIAAQSGSTAKIITGDALPILTAITLSGVNGVSQQVQYVNVGVTLQIAPRVSTDGFVTSQIYGVVSSVTGFSQGYPTISQREAETSASVRDGETFVIGGLTQENVITRKSRVPIVGDIPLVGNLFRQERSTRSKTELYIVITPRIVRHRRFAESASPNGDGALKTD
jgi:general secretion pathway protein D